MLRGAAPRRARAPTTCATAADPAASLSDASTDASACTGSSGAWTRKPSRARLLGAALGRSASAPRGWAAWPRCRSWRRAIASTGTRARPRPPSASIPFLVSPLSVTRDAPKLTGRRRGDASRDDDARVCATLVDAEGKLAAEPPRTSAGNRAGGFTRETSPSTPGVLLFLGLGYHHWVVRDHQRSVGRRRRRGDHPDAANRRHRGRGAYKRGELATGVGRAGGGTSLGWVYGSHF